MWVDGCRNGRRVILDRCNVTAADRKYFLGLIGNPVGVVAVQFQTNTEECKARVASRTDHPIPFGRGESAVTSMVKVLAPPLVGEGFTSVYTVTTDNDRDELLKRWGAAPPVIPARGFYKFPRTKHVINTGGTAVTRDDLVMDAAEAMPFCDGVLPNVLT